MSDNLRCYAETMDIVNELLDLANNARLRALADKRINQTQVPIDCFKRIIGDEIEKYSSFIDTLNERVKEVSREIYYTKGWELAA